MADNTARARAQIEGHRKHIRTHIEKYKKFTDSYSKATMVKQIETAQSQIRDLLRKHPSPASSREDNWRP